MGFVPRTQERVRNSRGKRAISVRATEVLLQMPFPDNSQEMAVISSKLAARSWKWH